MEGILGYKHPNRYQKNITHRRAINAFKRMGFKVKNGGNHVVVLGDGMRLPITGRGSRQNPRKVEKSARSACESLGIPWKEFLENLK